MSLSDITHSISRLPADLETLQTLIASAVLFADRVRAESPEARRAQNLLIDAFGACDAKQTETEGES